MSQPSSTSGMVVPQALRWHGELAAAAAYGCLRSLALTLRLRLDDPEQYLPSALKEPVILLFWHNRLALALPAYRHLFWRTYPDRRVAALISASKDGALLARLVEHHGVEAVRGSSSRRGAQAMRELVGRARRGYDLAITPDGPRGPKYQVHEGALALAQMTGLAILPMSARISPKKVFGSWDGFQLPLPFARCDIRVGQAIRVPRKLEEAEREQLRLHVQERLMELTVD